MNHGSHALSKLLSSGKFPRLPRGKSAEKSQARQLGRLQLEMLRIQQGVYHQQARAIIVFEGFDAAGKGGAIRRLTEVLDPRGFHVHAIGAPLPDEKGDPYLQRFWNRLPGAGQLAIFDRSWYGRVLVEKVEKLAPKSRLRQAYREINEFERFLADEGIDLVKIFLAISPEEQLERFEQRIGDPYKHWKINPADIEARRHWSDYVEAADEMFKRTATKTAPWHLIPADDKHYARIQCLRTVTRRLEHHGVWMEKTARKDRGEISLKELKAIRV